MIIYPHRSHGPAPIIPGHRAYSGPVRIHTSANPALVAETLRARSIRDQRGPHWDAYAGCDRAPMNWERV